MLAQCVGGNMLGGHTNRPGSLKEQLMSDVCAKAINEFQTVINCNSIENASNTPDFILAEFLGDCLDAFKTASNKREKWYGVALEPGKDNGAPSIQATNTPSPQLLALVALMKVSATVSTTAVLKVIYDEFPQLRA